MRDRRRSSLLALAAGLALGTPALAQPDAIASAEPPVRYDNHRVVRVFPGGVGSVRELQAALAFTDDVWTHSPRVGGPVDVRCTPEQFARLAASGLPFEVLIPNLQAAIERESAEINAARGGAGAGAGVGVDGPGWYASYKNYADVQAYCQQLAAAYPALCQLITLGNSAQGRPIFGLRITGPGPSAGRPGVFYHGCQHAREWVTVPTVVYIAEQLLSRYGTDPAVTAVMDGVEFFVAPIVNPDGYVYTWTTNRLWRKNRQANAGSSCVGTDLNRNWGFQWGGAGSSADACSDLYRGSAGFSGVETQVLRDFILSKPNLRAHIDYHSFGQLVLWPWSHTSAAPADQATFAQVGGGMVSAIEGASGTNYTGGAVSAIIGLASGGSVDWVYGSSLSSAARRWSFAVELRDTGAAGFQLPASQILGTAQENWRGALTLAQFVAQSAPPACYANCDGSTSVPALNALDFGCFLSRYQAGDAYANCDGSTSVPSLNALDFGCFLDRYRAGCP